MDDIYLPQEPSGCSMFCVAMFFILLLFCGLFCSDLCCYILNQAYCHLYIDGKQVYNGRQYFVEIHSVGENGNTKEVIIYRDKLKLKPKKVYVSNDVRMM